MNLDIRVVAEGGTDLHRSFISNIVNCGRGIAILTGVGKADKYVYIERDKPFNGNIITEQEISMQDLLVGYEYTKEKDGVRILSQDLISKSSKFKISNNLSYRPVKYCLEERQSDGTYLYQELIYKTTDRKEDITLGFTNDFTSLIKGSTPAYYLGTTSDDWYLKDIIRNQIRLAGYDRHLDINGISASQDKEEYNYHMNNLSCDLTELEVRLKEEGYYLFAISINKETYLLVVKNTFYGLIKLRTTAQ